MKYNPNTQSAIRFVLNRRIARPSTRRLLSAGLSLGLGSLGALGAAGEITPTSQTTGVEFSNPSANVTQVVAPNNAIINYSQFNIGTGETVRFVQPGTEARVLNRISGAAPSVIDGTLNANGIVYLVNPAGVTFGAGSVINVGGLYAAAGDISDADFGNGVNQFTGLTGAVSSYGLISAESMVALVGREVTHGGTIHAPQGTVVMSAGDSVLLGDARGGVYVSVAMSPENVNTGGVDVDGEVKAQNVSLIAGDLYSMAVSGLIDASSDDGVGGTVEVTGKTVELTGTIDASGATGGGTIHVGGGWQGESLATTDADTAFRTYVGPAAVLDAAAKEAGDGGTVVVWAEDATWYYGTTDASAGSVGDGGMVEVSGKVYLAYAGDVDAGSLTGVPGTVLLDPENIVIVAGGPGADDAEVADGSVLEGDRPGETLVISEAALEALSGDIVLEASNNIELQADLSDGVLDLFNATSLTLDAGNDITVIAPASIVDTPDGAPVTLIAGGNITLTLGAQVGADVISAGGDVDLSAGSVTVFDDITAGGDIFLTSNTSFIDVGNLSAGGVVDILGNSGVEVFGTVTTGIQGLLISSGADGILLAQDVTTNGGSIDLEATGGDVQLGDGNAPTIGTGGGAFTSTGVDFTNDGTINTQDNSGSSVFAGDVTINHIGTVSLGTILSGNTDLGTVTADDDFTIEAIGDIEYDSITSSNGDVNLTATDGGSILGNNANGVINADGLINLQAEGNINTGDLTANGGGGVAAPFSINVESQSNAELGNLTAQGGIQLISQGTLFAGNLQTNSPGQSLILDFESDFGGNQVTSPFAFATVSISGTSAGGGTITGNNGNVGWGGGDQLLQLNSSNGELDGQNLILDVGGFQDVVIGLDNLDTSQSLDDQGGIGGASDSNLAIGQNQTLTIITGSNPDDGGSGPGQVFIADSPFAAGSDSGGFNVIANEASITLNSVSTQGGQSYTASNGIILGSSDSTNNGAVTINSNGNAGFVAFNNDVTTNEGNGLNVTGNALTFQNVTTQGDINLTGGAGGVSINSIVDSNGGNIFITTGQIAFSATPTVIKPTGGDLAFFTRGGNLTITPFETVGVTSGSLIFDTATAQVAAPAGVGDISFGGVNVPAGSLLVSAAGNTTITETRNDLTATVNGRGGAGFLLVADAGENGGPFTSGFNGANINQVNGVRIDTNTLTLNHNGPTSVVIQSTNGQVIINANNVTLDPADQTGIVAVPNLVDATINPPAIQPNFTVTTNLQNPRAITLDLNALIAALLQNESGRPAALAPATQYLLLNEADYEALQRMGINARDLDAAERVDTVDGQIVIDDIPDKAGELSRSDYRVAITRLDPAAVRQALATYRGVLIASAEDGEQVSQRDEEIRNRLLEALTAFAEAGNPVDEDYDPAAFRRFVSADLGDAQLAGDLDQLKTLLGQIDRMGLNEVEEENSYQVIVERVTPPNVLTNAQMRALIMASAPAVMPGTPDGPADAGQEALLPAQPGATVAER